MSFLVAPSLLSSDFSQLGKEVKALEQAGADWIHWDIMDSHFVPNLTFGPPVLKALRSFSLLPFDVHLMVEKPEKLILPFAKAGANSITFHVEACSKPIDLINKIKSSNLKAGLSVKPNTPIDKVFPFLENLDIVLIMTVEPGAGGQVFLKEQAKKVSLLKNKLNSLKSSILIEVDGGITPETAKQVPQADILVAGNYIFKSGSYSDNISQLRNCI
ncbi:MAG: ribulose-phosphate 3-epimerase [Bdellovibrionaceae bacterium]|nr:ribulose-phosphate 3-epimerase [Pseudobdellovibrionaceae bacterium]